jgi:glycosyltransferase involved in cell wall biosynthesis
MIGENKAAIAQLIIDLLDNENQLIALAEKGRLFVELNYSWKTHNKKLAEIIVG